MTDDDALMVADRLGLTPDDADECRQALLEVDADGYDVFIERTRREAAAAVTAASIGLPPSPGWMRRAEVRYRIAEGLMEFLRLRQQFLDYQGPVQ